MASTTVFEIRTDRTELQIPRRASSYKGEVKRFLDEHVDPAAGYAGEGLNILGEYADKAAALEALKGYHADIEMSASFTNAQLIHVVSYWALAVTYELDETGERDYAEAGDPIKFAPFPPETTLRINRTAYDWDAEREQWIERPDEDEDD